MKFNDLFNGGSLQWIHAFVGKIVYDGFNITDSKEAELAILLVSTLIVIFLLYKLVWIVFKTMRFIIGLLEW
jgi:hypothetical protein